jgi:hypothetical protein
MVLHFDHIRKRANPQRDAATQNRDISIARLGICSLVLLERSRQHPFVWRVISFTAVAMSGALSLPLARRRRAADAGAPRHHARLDNALQQLFETLSAAQDALETVRNYRKERGP